MSSTSIGLSTGRARAGSRRRRGSACCGRSSPGWSARRRCGSPPRWSRRRAREHRRGVPRGGAGRRAERRAAADPRGAAAPVHARRRVPARALRGRRAADGRHAVLPDDIHVGAFGDALLASLVIAAVSLVLQAILGTNDDDQYSLRVTRRIARRQGATETSDVPGILFLEIDGLALPVLRDAMRDGSAPTMAGWIAEDGYRLAEWEPDLSSQTGASQAGILLGSNEDIPAFRWVEKESGRLFVVLVAGGLRRDRGPPRDRHRAARRRRREPRQPALRRGRGDDPDRQPQRRREARQPRLPGVPRQRLQRHARARAVLLGDRAGADRRGARRPAGRATARAPRRHLSAPARDDVRDRARPDRLRRADGHDARPPRGVRDVLELRRGRAPLRPRARRHDGGAAQARRAVRPARTRAPVRPAPVRDRRALRPRADPGRDVQAAPRLRARRARRAVAPRTAGWRGSPAATSRTRWCAAPSRRRPAAARAKRPKNDVSHREVVVLGSGNLGPRLPHAERAPAHGGGDRRAPSRADPHAAEHPHIGWLLVRSAEHGAVVLGPSGRRVSSTRGASRATIRSRPSPPPRAAICGGRTASPTSPTSWSAASTTRCSTRAARSRS